MSYFLATNENVVRWYKFNDRLIAAGAFELVDTLSLDQLPQFPDKAAAKNAAIALGLRTWRYVRI